MHQTDPAELVRRLTELRIEHRDLDTAIAHLAELSGRDELQVKRLKKRKLVLKDAIAKIESALIPDLNA